MEDLTGRHFGAFRIVAPLGEGGMAAVYKAFQPAMDRYVALKVLPRHFANDPEFVGRFRQEAKVLAQLQHPHILPVYDFGEADGYSYIVMPFVESGTLTDLLKGQPLPLQQIRLIIMQVGDALDYAHSQGVVHRDVKPSNVLLDKRGNCLLTDFGIAKIVEGTLKLTMTGAVIGTPAYMSPEQGLGQKPDGRSDIYALGVILYEMATGRTPYIAETPMAVVIKHIHAPLPLPRTLNPALPETVERVILKALAKHPEDRYATAGDMVRAVQVAIPDTSQVVSVAPVETAAQSTVLAAEGELREAPPQPDSRAVPQVEGPKPTLPVPIQRASAALPKWILAVGGLTALATVIGASAVFGAAVLASRTATQTIAAVVPPATDTPRPGLTIAPPILTPTSPQIPKPTSTLTHTPNPTATPSLTLAPVVATTVVPPASGLTVKLPYMPAESGLVSPYGDVLTGGNHPPQAGDLNNDGVARGFLSFDLTVLPVNASVQSARLVLPRPEILGQPGQLGDLSFEAVWYGPALNSAAYDTPGDMLLQDGYSIEGSTIVVAPGIVEQAIARGQIRFQIRFAFALGTNGNGSADEYIVPAYSDNPGGIPSLIAVYTVP